MYSVCETGLVKLARLKGAAVGFDRGYAGVALEQNVGEARATAEAHRD
jgi:hypothetical protein